MAAKKKTVEIAINEVKFSDDDGFYTYVSNEWGGVKIRRGDDSLFISHEGLKRVVEAAAMLTELED